MNGTARRVAVLVLAAAALAGCASTTAGSGTPALGATAGGDPTTLPIPSGTATASPAPTVGGDSTPVRTSAAPSGSPAPAGKRVQVGAASVPVPDTATARAEGDYLCLTLLNDTGCSLEVIDIAATRAGGGSVSTPNPGARYGWSWGSDVPGCGSGTDVSAITKETVLGKGFKAVGPKKAAWAAYLVSCQNGDQDFDPQVWWLPTSQIAFRQRSTVAGTSEAIAPILAGVTFSS